MTLQQHWAGTTRTRLPLITWTLLELLCIGTGAKRSIDIQLKYSHTFVRGGESGVAKTMGEDLLVLFSDVDGTIVHYPDDFHNLGESILKLPPSSTGLRGIISAATLAKFSSIRKAGVKVVLISGMRTATLLKRLPYLPKADAYCCEAGGRIFYPTRDSESGFSASPKPFDGADPADLSRYGLVEDMDWRHNMEKEDNAGKDGFVGNELDGAEQVVIALDNRTGLLWSYARELQNKGFVLDTKGYSTCFRVNRRHQESRSDDDFDSLARGEIEYPLGLATSTNLGAVDFYPSSSGKKRCCEYLARKFSQAEEDSALAERCVCLCDDDNDVEMALSCLHAYIPSLSSDSMRETILKNEDKFTATFDNDIEGTRATEAALDLVLARTKSAEHTSTY